jgi:hypothetical protein
MKQSIKKSRILHFSVSFSLITLIIYLVISLFIIKKNQLDFFGGEIIMPNGVIKKIEPPHKYNTDESQLILTYNLSFKNTQLFSGNLHVIPIDCIESFSINNQLIPDSLYKDKCDSVNGFYINIDSYVTSGINNMQLKIKNSQSPYRLNILDETFYEKYVFYGALLLCLSLINFKRAFIEIKKKSCGFFNQTNKTLVWIMSSSSLLISSIVFSSFWMRNTKLYTVILITALLISVLSPLLYLIYKKFSYPRITICLLLISFFTWVLYLIILPHDAYSYDNQGHLSYIRYITNTGHIPIANGGWLFYHPSLYYLLASKSASVLNINHILYYFKLIKLLQTFSLIIFLGYIFISLATIDLILKNFRSSELNQNAQKRIFVAAATIFISWTSNSIFSVRVGNDTLFNLLFVASFYYIVKWWFTEKNYCYILALFLASLDVWAKTNGLIAFGIIAATVFLKYTFRFNSKSIASVNHGLVFLIFFSVTAYFSFHEKVEKRTRPNEKLIVGNTQGLSSAFNVGNAPRNYIELNPYDFIKIPYTSSLEDNKGRQFFLFYLFKTSMFGEFTFNKSSYLPILAKIASALFLIGILFLFYGYFNALSNLKVFLPILICGATLIISIALFRFFYPFSCSNDFRYIFPAVLPASLIVGLSLEKLQKRFLIYRVSIALVSIFIFVSQIFQIICILIF